MSASQKILAGASTVAKAAYLGLKYLVAAATAGYAAVLSFGYIAPIVAGWIATLAAGTVVAFLLNVAAYAAVGAVACLAALGVVTIFGYVKSGISYLTGLWAARSDAKVLRKAAEAKQDAAVAAAEAAAATVASTDAPAAAAA